LADRRSDAAVEDRGKAQQKQGHSMSQIVERFEAAVQVLVSEGPVKIRLRRAYTEHLEDLQQVELPIESNVEFDELHSALHRVEPVGKVDYVEASVAKMSPAEAWWHAQTIVRLYTEVLAMERGARVEADAALKPAVAAPPRFLAGRG
jgi:hypothetical protein